MRKSKLIRGVITWGIVIVLLAVFVIFVGIPLFSEEETFTGKPPVVAYYEGDNKPVTMENDDLLFELDPATTHFKLTEKATGREWYSNPVDADSDPIANQTNKENLKATLMVQYSTSGGTINLNNYKYSIEEGIYTIHPEEDGAIRVDYTIGKVDKVYIIPTAITVERFNAFMEAMGTKNSKKVKSNYTLYEPSKLEGKDEIVANYPEVVNQPLYVLKSGTTDTNKSRIEKYFAEGGYTYEDYEADQQLVAGKKSTQNAVFNVSVIYRLDGKDFLVEVPYSEIRYNASYPITQLTVLPMFAAAGTADQGFSMVPEGGGALIDFNNGKQRQNSYYANLYGWDWGSERTEVISETRVDFPVFGMARNDGAFICMIESAAANAIIQADISGRYNSYNTVSAIYKVLHADRFNISAKTAQLVYMYEKEIPDDTIIQRYRFLDKNSYVEMATAYGDYLRERYPELASESASETAPVVVELVGAIDKKVIKFGLPVDSVVPVTTFSEAETILDDLIARNVKNLNLRMSGWCNGGITQKVLTNVKVIRSLGGQAGMDRLIAKCKEENVPLYFEGVTAFAYDSNLLDGFLSYRDAARFTTREHIEVQPYDPITYVQMDWLDSFYLVRPQYAKKNASNLIESLSEAKATGVSFRDIGKFLSGNYNPKDTTSREKVKQMNLDTLQEAKDAGLNVMVKQGNDYVLPYANIITDMDLDGINYSILDRMVPFYEIAIHGMKDYTSSALNIAGDYETQLLQCAEYGAGLNYTFFAENAQVLQDSVHTGYYGAEYTVWAEKAAADIERFQREMAGLNNQRIVDHAYVDKEVTMTRYADGTTVYVNYGKQDYNKGGLMVPARDYYVKGGDTK